MVRSGWALAYRRYSDDYVEEEAIAQAAQAGLWRGEFVPPWEWLKGEAAIGRHSPRQRRRLAVRRWNGWVRGGLGDRPVSIPQRLAFTTPH